MNISQWTDRLNYLSDRKSIAFISKDEYYCLVVGVIDYLQGEISQTEMKNVLGSGQKRTREFVAGRNVAHIALSELNIPDIPIKKDSNRAPVWPNGVVGSISHNDNLAAAIVCRSGAYDSIGVDIEDSSPLSQDLVDLIMTESEIHNIRLSNNIMPTDYSKIIFSAKEAIFKCDWQIWHDDMDFKDVEIKIFNENYIIGDVKSYGYQKERSYVVDFVVSDSAVMTVASSIVGRQFW